MESSSSSDCPFRLARKKERNGKICGGVEKDFANFPFNISLTFLGGNVKLLNFGSPFSSLRKIETCPHHLPPASKDRLFPSPRKRRETGSCETQIRRKGKCVNERLSHFSSSSSSPFSNAHSQRFGGRK